MDESTSALDSKTEETIIQNIKNNFKHKTMIMIAHRKETIQKCDEVWCKVKSDNFKGWIKKNNIWGTTN